MYLERLRQTSFRRNRRFHPLRDRVLALHHIGLRFAGLRGESNSHRANGFPGLIVQGERDIEALSLFLDVRLSDRDRFGVFRPTFFCDFLFPGRSDNRASLRANGCNSYFVRFEMFGIAIVVGGGFSSRGGERYIIARRTISNRCRPL